MAFAFLTCGVLPVSVSMAQFADDDPARPEDSPLTLSCPGPNLVFYLDDESGPIAVNVTGVNAGGTVNAAGAFAVTGGGGNGSVGLEADGFDFTGSQNLSNGQPTKTFTAEGSPPRSITFDKSGNTNVDRITLSCGDPGTKKLSLDKELSSTPDSFDQVGDVLQYEYVVTNTGTVALTGPFTINDDKTTDEACPATVSLAPGASITCTSSYTVKAEDLTAGFVTNQATASGDGVTSNVDTVTVNSTVAPEKKLTLDKTSTTGSFEKVGDVLQYEYKVTNSGTTALDGPFEIDDDKSTDEFCPVTASLAPGASITCTATYTVKQEDFNAGFVTNEATASGDGVTSNVDTVTVNSKVTPTKTLLLDKSTTTPNFSAIGQVIPYSYLVTNTGNVTVDGPFTIDDDRTTNEACPVIVSLAPGASVTCSSTYTVTEEDYNAGYVTNVATASGGGVTSNADSVTVERAKSDDEIIEEAFQSQSYNFIAQRLNLLASNGPRLAWLVNRVEGGFGGGTNSLNVVGENGDLTGSFAFSSGALRSAVAGERVMPTADAPRSDGGVNAWIEGQFAIYNDERDEDDVNGDFFVGYAGVDIEVMDRVNIGIMGEIDWMNEDGDDNAEVEGLGWMIGPYLSAEIADGIFLDMRAMGGTTDNDIRQAVLGIDYDGDFQTTRWLAEATLSGNYEFDSVTLTPDIRLLHIRENQEDYNVSGGGKTVDVDGNDVVLTQLSSGLRLSHLILTDDMMMRPYIAGRLFWNFDNPGELTIDGEYISTEDVRGAVTIGLDGGSDNMQFGIEGTYDGLFAEDDYAISGRLSFGYRF
jgi:hypothetical protein